MTTLKGATFSKTFADGFREGYKSRMGKDAAAVPATPAGSVPEGVGAYLSGVASGVAAALKVKPVRDASSG
jgi:hypothetical protein